MLFQNNFRSENDINYFYFVFVDIRLDWRIYSFTEKSCGKLIDVKIWVGDAFPLREKTKRNSENLRRFSETSFNVTF